MCTLL